MFFPSQPGGPSECDKAPNLEQKAHKNHVHMHDIKLSSIGCTRETLHVTKTNNLTSLIWMKPRLSLVEHDPQPSKK
jgi:hypothetical protein